MTVLGIGGVIAGCPGLHRLIWRIWRLVLRTRVGRRSVTGHSRSHANGLVSGHPRRPDSGRRYPSRASKSAAKSGHGSNERSASLRYLHRLNSGRFLAARGDALWIRPAGSHRRRPVRLWPRRRQPQQLLQRVRERLLIDSADGFRYLRNADICDSVGGPAATRRNQSAVAGPSASPS